jgi:hypothetical protein
MSQKIGTKQVRKRRAIKNQTEKRRKDNQTLRKKRKGVKKKKKTLNKRQ